MQRWVSPEMLKNALKFVTRLAANEDVGDSPLSPEPINQGCSHGQRLSEFAGREKCSCLLECHAAGKTSESPRSARVPGATTAPRWYVAGSGGKWSGVAVTCTCVLMGAGIGRLPRWSSSIRPTRPTMEVPSRCDTWPLAGEPTAASTRFFPSRRLSLGSPLRKPPAVNAAGLV
jgi:hypothetical protein